MFRISAKANKEADVYIYEDVGEGWFGGVTAKQFAMDLKAAGDVTLLNLHINSYGGDVFDGLAIYRQLVDHKAKVITFIDGIAASIASIIAMAGSEIRIGASSQIMIHDAWGVQLGNAEHMRRMADMLETTSSSLADVYVARTSNDIKQVRGWMADETWFLGKEAVDNGFADSVMENMKVAAHFDPTKHKFKKAPSNTFAVANLDALRQRVAQMKAKIQRRNAA